MWNAQWLMVNAHRSTLIDERQTLVEMTRTLRIAHCALRIDPAH
jgi:hypothetical protein